MQSGAIIGVLTEPEMPTTSPMSRTVMAMAVIAASRPTVSTFACVVVSAISARARSEGDAVVGAPLASAVLGTPLAAGAPPFVEEVRRAVEMSDAVDSRSPSIARGKPKRIEMKVATRPKVASTSADA